MSILSLLRLSFLLEQPKRDSVSIESDNNFKSFIMFLTPPKINNANDLHLEFILLLKYCPVKLFFYHLFSIKLCILRFMVVLIYNRNKIFIFIKKIG